MQRKFANKLHPGDRVWVRRSVLGSRQDLLGKVVKTWIHPQDQNLVMLDVRILEHPCEFTGEIIQLNHKQIS